MHLYALAYVCMYQTARNSEVLPSVRFIAFLLLMLAEMQQAQVCQQTLQHQVGKLHHFVQEETIP